MSREQERIRKRLEKNPIVECNKIQKKFVWDYFPCLEKWQTYVIEVI